MNTEEQRIFAYQILNEVLHGYEIDNFETQLGANQEGARSIWKRVNECSDLLELTAQDRLFLRNATALTLREVEDGMHEFPTRTGFEVADAQWIIDFLNAGLIGE